MSRYFVRGGAARGLGWLLLGLILCTVFKPGAAYAWWNGDWTARRAITIDTSAAGGAITDPIGTTPVLIRLDVGDFSFDAANPDGSDLRFVAADDKTLLSYHIEKYDHLLAQAFVWVAVPDLKPGVPASIFLYYGNPKAAAADDAKATYDANMALVYHFGEHGAPARDWTGNGNTARTAGAADDYAIIAGGMRLDGQATVTLPASASLAWAGGNGFTWAAWINETALQPGAVLYSRTDGTNTVQIGVDNGVPFVTVTTPAGVQKSSGGAPVAAASWHYLALTANGGQMTLYLDGAPYGTLGAALPALNTAAYLGGDATTGTLPAAAPAAPAAAGTPPAGTPPAGTPPAAAATAATAPAATVGFIGTIDELEISNIARGAGYIKFAAIGQGNNPLAGKLISYAVEQKPASWFSGPLVVILGAVTPDGWVIIGILMVMAVVSWIVMADKISYVNRVDKANSRFTERFRDLSYDLTSLPKKGGAVGAAAVDDDGLDASPLYGIYQIGAHEIHLRFAHAPAGGTNLLSAQSIAAIRSALDTGLVRQTQRLNKSMVLLTIAISGGPFLGLLGTVVGVMITFATIAEAGDVNVNAIAPGISAALVATVAGLIVAIPALFGYNYLNSRIRNGVSDMQVFVDEFETKMAEYYSPGTVKMPSGAAE